MKWTSRLLVILLVLLVIPINTAYTEETGNEYKMEEEETYKEGYEIGKVVGGLDGESVGKTDFDGNSAYNLRLPTRRDVEDKYNLDKFDWLYRTGFYEGYRKAYEESYKKSYFDLTKSQIIQSQSGEIEYSKDYQMGYQMGSLEGGQSGEEDSKRAVIEGRPNNYNEYMPSKNQVSTKFLLHMDTRDFENGFIKGYTDKYKEKFSENYRVTLLNRIKEGKDYNLNMRGGNINSEDNKLSLNFTEGAVYLDNFVEVVEKSLKDSVLTEIRGKIRTSKFYEVNVNNGDGVTIHKPVKLEIDYIGVPNVGIYDATKNVYLDTFLDGDKVYTYINPSHYTGGTYVVYIDTDKPIPNNYYRSVYKTELINLYKNGYINGKEDINKSLTKGELIYYLGRGLDWDKSPMLDFMYRDITDYVDYSGITSNQLFYIRYAVTKGYIVPSIDSEGNRVLGITDRVTVAEKMNIVSRIDSGYSMKNRIESNINNGILTTDRYVDDRGVTLEILLKTIYDLQTK